MTKQRARAWSFIIANAVVMIFGYHNCSGGALQSGFDGAVSGNKLASIGAAAAPNAALPANPVSNVVGPHVAASTNGGGDGYDGAVAYAAYARGGQTCPDGSNIVSQIQVDDNGQAYLTRDNCATIQPQHINPNNYQKVSGLGSDYIVIGGQAYYNTSQSTAQQNVNLFCHGYTETTPTDPSAILAALQKYDTLVFVNYMSPQVVSVNVVVSGNQAQVSVSGHASLMFAMTMTGSSSYNGQTADGDQMSLDSTTGLISIVFADHSTPINNMDLTCEVPQ